MEKSWRLLPWSTLVALLAWSSSLSAGGLDTAREIVETTPLTESVTTANAAPKPRVLDKGHSEQPTLYTASYKASYNGLPIRTVRSLSRSNGRYLLSLNAKNFLGKISEEEFFTIAKGGRVTPEKYTYERSLIGNKRREQIIFDRNNGQVINHYKGEEYQFSLEPTHLGPISYQLQMRQDLAAGKETFSYPVIQRGRLKYYNYSREGEEILHTPLGDMATLVLKRDREESDRETYLWLAKELDYLPVKLLQKEDGEIHEMLIEAYTVVNPEDI